jgi:hypothetical protein
LFEEMDTVTNEFQPPLSQWQAKLEGLFTNLLQGFEGAEEVRRSHAMMLTLKAVDWRQHNTHAVNDREYTMQTIHLDDPDVWITSEQLEPWSSSEPANLVGLIFICTRPLL